MSKERIVYFEWVDSDRYEEGGWEDRSDAEKHAGKRAKPMPAAGLVVLETDDFITITTTMHDGEVFSRLSVAKLQIVGEIRELRIGRKKTVK